MTSGIYPRSDFHDDSLRDADGPSIIFGPPRAANKQDILAALPVKHIADRMITNFFAHMEYGPGEYRQQQYAEYQKRF